MEKKGLRTNNQHTPLEVDEEEIQDAFTAEEEAYQAFKAILAKDNLKCKKTRKTAAVKAPKDAKRRHKDVLDMSETIKEIKEIADQ